MTSSSPNLAKSASIIIYGHLTMLLTYDGDNDFLKWSQCQGPIMATFISLLVFHPKSL